MTPDDAFIHGIPYPGVYVTDEDGRVIAKFFHDSYKKRDSPEIYIDAAMGETLLNESAPTVCGGDENVKLTVAVHGGKGTVRQGIIRHLVVRFELPKGLHIYGPPVPEGMVHTEVKITGPSGFCAMTPELPPTKKLTMDIAELNVWHGVVDFIYPFYATGDLASECRPLDQPSIEISVQVRYQACTQNECLIPKTETFSVMVDLDVIDIPDIDVHRGHGQRSGNYDGTPALIRLITRKAKQNPVGVPLFILKNLWLRLLSITRKLKS